MHLVPRAQPSHVRSHYTQTAFDPSFGTGPSSTVSYLEQKLSLSQSFMYWKLVLILLFAHVWP